MLLSMLYRNFAINQGFTLSEVLIVLAIGAILAGLAAPGFASLRHNAALTAAADELLGALYLAQRSAARTGLPAVFCLTPDGGAQCVMGKNAAGTSWQVFLDLSASSALQPAGSGLRLRQSRLASGVQIRATRPAVTFWPAARAATTGTFTVCDPRDRSSARAVIVSETGRPRIAETEGGACVF